MNLLKETIEYRADSEEAALDIIQDYRAQANEKGYEVIKSSYVRKDKKAKGEIVDTAYVVSITMQYATVWEV